MVWAEETVRSPRGRRDNSKEREESVGLECKEEVVSHVARRGGIGRRQDWLDAGLLRLW